MAYDRHEEALMRDDPGQLSATCPACGGSVSTPPGEPVPPHQPVSGDDRGMCPGAGSPGL